MSKIKSYKFILLLLGCLLLQLIIKSIFGYILSHEFNLSEGASHKVNLGELNIFILPIVLLTFALVEELMFRLPLKKSKLHFYTSCALILCWICFKFFDFWLIVIISLVFIILYLKRKYIYNKWTGINSYTLIISYNILFALVHLSNYSNSVFLYENLLGILLILTSHLFSGLIFSYIYLKSNILYSTLIHFLGNAFFIYLYLYL